VIRTIKVLAYVLRDEHLLVVEHPDDPIAGLQVPQGTVGEGEDIREAVVREVWGETGLAASINGYLGVAEYDMSEYGRAEVQERHVFQLEAPVNAPTEPWGHVEDDPSGGGPAVRFRLSWLHLDDPGLKLEAGHGALLDRVRRPAA
jgi:8-oxo-dGTP pyrophosphatase MutT (NUDIX family)